MRRIDCSNLLKALYVFSVLSFAIFVNKLNAQDYAISFDGTAGQTIETDRMIPYGTEFTVMGWVDISGSVSRIFSWGSSQVNNYATIEVYMGKLRFYVPGNNGVNLSSFSVLQNTGWHHIAVTQAENTIKIYIDGVLESTGSFSKEIIPTKTNFGAGLLNGSLNGKGDGTYDLFSFWDSALTAPQILRYMTTNPVATEEGIIAFYDFNNPAVIPGGNNSSETFLTDVSGNGYNAILIDFPLYGDKGNWIGEHSVEVTPLVATTAVQGITYTSALTGGNVLDCGTAPVTATGICWNTTGNPTIADNFTIDQVEDGLFTSSLSGLDQSTSYYVKAYATNAAGTSYGLEESFTTLTSSVTLADLGIYLFIIIAIVLGILTVKKGLF